MHARNPLRRHAVQIQVAHRTENFHRVTNVTSLIYLGKGRHYRLEVSM